MPSNDPTSYSIATYAWVVTLASWGGIANYARKLRDGIITRFSITELIGELVISGFTGLMTFYLCVAGEVQEPVSAVLVGISGHMGSRGIYLIENILKRRYDATPVQPETETDKTPSHE